MGRDEFVHKASADDLMAGAGGSSSSSWLSAASWTSLPYGGWTATSARCSAGATAPGHLRAWGCGLRSLQQLWIDTTTPIGEATFHITIAWAG